MSVVECQSCGSNLYSQPHADDCLFRPPPPTAEEVAARRALEKRLEELRAKTAQLEQTGGQGG